MIYESKVKTLIQLNSMLLFLEEDLRVHMDELFDMDLEIVKKYAEISKSKRVEFLHKVLKDMAT